MKTITIRANSCPYLYHWWCVTGKRFQLSLDFSLWQWHWSRVQSFSSLRHRDRARERSLQWCSCNTSWNTVYLLKKRDSYCSHVTISQSGHWWLFGATERSHKKRPEHPGWGRHDTHSLGRLPRTHWSSSAGMQQRVSSENTHNLSAYWACSVYRWLGLNIWSNLYIELSS